MRDLKLKRTAIDVADEIVPIAQVCRWSGVVIPDGFLGKSWKTYCPLSDIWHLESVVERTLRIYPDTNSAWCFAGCNRFTPSDMMARKLGISRIEAARELLDRVGYRPPTLAERWRQACEPDAVVDVEWLGLALRTFCERISSDHWSSLQFEQSVAVRLDECLSLLELVKTPEDANKWLTTTKTVMQKVLGEIDECVAGTAP